MSSAGIAVSSVREDLALAPVPFDGFRLPHCVQESILIYLSIPGSSVIPMRVLESDSIASVKLRIQAFKGFVAKKQRLVLDGREMARNSCFVRDYGVENGKVLHLVLRLSDLRLITVETTCGKTFKFQVPGSRSVGHIKQLLANKGRGLVDLNDQKLICDGEELEDQRLIDDVSNKTNAVIHLLVCKSTKVNTRSVGKEFELTFVAPDSEESVGVEKLQITEQKTPGRNFVLEPVLGNPKVELHPMIKELVSSVFCGLDKGNFPVRSSEGSGGVYFMQDATGREHIAVFKPIDEEPMAVHNPRGLPVSVDGEGLKSGTRVGEGAFREVAAYILDHPKSGRRSFSNDQIGFAGVPPTVLVKCLHEGFNHPGGYQHSAKNYKIGSLQMFMKNNGSCEDIGPRAFPVEEVHKISVLDMRLANADRHGGNILVHKSDEEGRLVLIPIDHGYCLPENFEDCTFEWLYWPQAREPFSSETIEYIKSLDAEEDIALLKFHGWKISTECARTLRISTMLLKKGAERGLTPFTIGNMMCRETVKTTSVIENIVHEAKEAVLPVCSEETFMECISEIVDAYLDNLPS